ncbi:MAG TPA: LLM class F420-dependent oxidoreductase [Dehalococcoidia bacterium]|nr:LLM class F420-dependent oxidoreductase [Dehalococcoidia bacterium]
MKFGFQIPNFGTFAWSEDLIALSQKAEELGYDSVWVADHIIVPTDIHAKYPYSRSGRFPIAADADFLEPLTVLTYVAGATRRIRLGTTVLILPYRNPLVNAKVVATLDAVSGGRVILGVGVGWMEDEFRILGLEEDAYRERGRITDEHIKIYRECWTNSAPVYHGDRYQLDGFRFLPTATQQPSIPIWVGGHSKAALRRAAELGDGWHAVVPSLEEFQEAVVSIRERARAVGRRPDDVTMSVHAGLMLLDEPSERVRPKIFAGTPTEVRDQIRRFEDAGCEYFVFDQWGADRAQLEATMERFANDVAAKY